ncbi:DNA-binding transcriptional MerR regulator [Promicromonospora sp. AC04]|uniref:MerR family transcriptional regulator n=1 Tax=Promicromonospora sp. AC04 TaxID=2135723 RepID=UPI000D3DC7F0|nr:MerR family transcriptional regulator [Promicromonospora sp. AC04]PUB26291.1 DNA-binding transcriptional MerR regulator [Promicromonospora sp. AC04]
MLTIGQLASYAGVTARAVRHYHAKGLLPEPGRDHSGYRRYDAQAVVDLIRIRILADAGVPLARVHELLRADEEEFAAAVAEIDTRLRAEIAERERHRERIARLAAGDSLALPPEGAAYLDRWRELGVPERIVQIERDSWILTLAVLSPEQVAEAMALKGRLLDDPQFVDLLRSLSEAVGWGPDDPRVAGLADRVAAVLDHHAEWGDGAAGEMEAGLVELFDSIALDSIPAGRRLESLLEERGWSGWTRQQRVGREPGRQYGSQTTTASAPR